YAMFGTLYPDEKGLNKPAFFFSRDGKAWNDSPSPYTVQKKDIVSITGYDKYPDADINRMNVILFEDNKFRIYFADFKNFGHVFRATSNDGHNYIFDSKVLDGHFAPNDVKKFRVGDQDWYLMGLHLNTRHLSYTVSTDPLNFPPARKLFEHQDDSDAYM